MPMKLVNLKISNGDRDAKNSEASLATEAPAYPWGLSINLDSDTLEKLECDVSEFKVGSKMRIMAAVEVTSVSSNETRGAGESSSVSLQITDMALDDEGKKSKDASKALYQE